MILSYTSILSAVLSSSLVALILVVLIGYFKRDKFLSTKMLLVIGLIFMIRLILPFEFFFTISVPSQLILPSLKDFFSSSILMGGHRVHIHDVLIIIWLIGVIVSAVFFYLKLKEITRLRKISELFKVQSSNVVFVDKIVSPAVIGVIRPIIIMPNLNLTERQKELVLTHELFHISSFDILIKYIYGLLSVFYWWNPVVHLFKKHLNLIIELKTDDQVIEKFSMKQKIEYVETLLVISKALANFNKQDARNRTNFLVTLIPDNESSLLLRSKNILINEKKRVEIHNILLLGVMCLLLSTSFIIEPSRIPSEIEEQAFSIDKNNSYLIEVTENEYKLYHNSEYMVNITENQRIKEFKELKILE